MIQIVWSVAGLKWLIEKVRHMKSSMTLFLSTSACHRWWTQWSRTTGSLHLWTVRLFYINWCSSAGWRSVTRGHASPTSLARWTSCCATPPASKHSPPHTQGKCVCVCVWIISGLVITLTLRALCNIVLYFISRGRSKVLRVCLLTSATVWLTDWRQIGFFFLY